MFEGPLDVVGDIHGEIDALHGLLRELGYDRLGRHPAGRRLVFVGDLVDRGPDSPAVVEFVAQLVQQGLAQCLLGNHELNLLRTAKKSGNAWFLDARHAEQAPDGEFAHSRLAPSGFHEQALAFFAELPLGLERADLRVVHAAWVPRAIDDVRALTLPAAAAYRFFDQQSQAAITDADLPARAAAERALWHAAIHDRHASPPLLEAVGLLDERHQMGNPLRVLTSGVERVARAPFWASGQWRMVDRVRWWEEYTDATPVIVGHYWRRLKPLRATGHAASKPDWFGDIAPLAWLGPLKNVFCVDYSVGGRYEERKQGVRKYATRLCAMRWPEREVWGEQGRVVGA
ncbi:MAG: metallophosphoesterase [Pseudomonadota bacterium]